MAEFENTRQNGAASADKLVWRVAHVRTWAKRRLSASWSSASYQLSILQRKGYLRRSAGHPRTIDMRLPGQPTVRLEVEDLAGAADLPSQDPPCVPAPLYGQVVAGPQNLTERLIGDTWDRPIRDTWELPRDSLATGRCSASESVVTL